MLWIPFSSEYTPINNTCNYFRSEKGWVLGLGSHQPRKCWWHYVWVCGQAHACTALWWIIQDRNTQLVGNILKKMHLGFYIWNIEVSKFYRAFDAKIFTFLWISKKSIHARELFEKGLSHIYTNLWVNLSHSIKCLDENVAWFPELLIHAKGRECGCNVIGLCLLPLMTSFTLGMDSHIERHNVLPQAFNYTAENSHIAIHYSSILSRTACP